MKIKEQNRMLAAGWSKHGFEVVDRTDEVSNIYTARWSWHGLKRFSKSIKKQILPFITEKSVIDLLFYKKSSSEHSFISAVNLLYWLLGLLGKGLVTKKFQPRFTNLVFAGFSVFFSSKNAILTRIGYGLATAPQIQRRSFPIVHSQIRKLKHVAY